MLVPRTVLGEAIVMLASSEILGPRTSTLLTGSFAEGDAGAQLDSCELGTLHPSKPKPCAADVLAIFPCHLCCRYSCSYLCYLLPVLLIRRRLLTPRQPLQRLLTERNQTNRSNATMSLKQTSTLRLRSLALPTTTRMFRRSPARRSCGCKHRRRCCGTPHRPLVQCSNEGIDVSLAMLLQLVTTSVLYYHHFYYCCYYC